jgi:hypothetical protein
VDRRLEPAVRRACYPDNAGRESWVIAG